MNKALILIDIQMDYFKGGACELINPIEASLKAKSLLETFREKKLPLFHIQHINEIRPNATFFLPNTKGIEIHENVKPLEREVVIQKNFPNSFLQTNLENELEKLNIKELVICGMMSHMCVDATTRAAFDLGFKCTVAHDACTTKNLEFQGEVVPHQQVHHAFMSALSAVYATMKTTEEIIRKL